MDGLLHKHFFEQDIGSSGGLCHSSAARSLIRLQVDLADLNEATTVLFGAQGHRISQHTEANTAPKFILHVLWFAAQLYSPPACPLTHSLSQVVALL